MEFFLEMLLTAVVSLLFSFLVSQLVSVAMVGNSGSGGNDPTSDQVEKPEIDVGYDFVTEKLHFGLKMDATVLENKMNFQVVDENVEPGDRFGSEADRVDELEEAATGSEKDCAQPEELVVRTAEAESTATVSPENVIAKVIIVRGLDEGSGSAAEISGGIEELMVRTTEAVITASVSPENVVAEQIMIRGHEERSESTEERSGCVEKEESGYVVASEVRVEERENNTEEESESIEASKEKKELIIEEDDDWEGIEWSELEKAFAAAANYLEESRKAEKIGAEAKMELYGLHKIATEGSCREAQPLAVMVAARAKWNAWQKLGNMNQEEAMEQYLALISREIPGWMNTEGKMPELVTSLVLPPNSGSLEDPTTLDTTCVESSRMVKLP